MLHCSCNVRLIHTARIVHSPSRQLHARKGHRNPDHFCIDVTPVTIMNQPGHLLQHISQALRDGAGNSGPWCYTVIVRRPEGSHTVKLNQLRILPLITKTHQTEKLRGHATTAERTAYLLANASQRTETNKLDVHKCRQPFSPREVYMHPPVTNQAHGNQGLTK